jgi:hypothetical protein
MMQDDQDDSVMGRELMKTDYEALLNAFASIETLAGNPNKLQPNRTEHSSTITLGTGPITFYFSKDGSLERISLPGEKGSDRILVVRPAQAANY